MCGICGIVGERNENLIRRMTGTMIHRGHDDEGYFFDENVSLGMRRLSIIDISGGKQPVYNEAGNICVIYNGEIYNFVEIRKELEKAGHFFKTNCDTEVIIHSYEEFGEKCVEKFNGMFAFAIWDKIQKKLFLARDRVGIKPLYYCLKNGKLFFASEIKALLCADEISREVNIQGLNLYTTFQYVPAPDTMFKDIHKLPHGHYLVWKNGETFIQRYWDIPFQTREDLTLEEIKEELMHNLKKSVKMRLISDVPVGVLLSGGIDSSTITGVMARLCNERIKTFTVRFKGGKKYDEGYYAKIVSERFKTEHHEFVMDSPQIDILPKVIYHMDEPIADEAALPLYHICETSKNYVTVVLTGEGGDELFAGYPRYLLHKISLILNNIPASLRETFFKSVKNLPFLSHRMKIIIDRFERYSPSILRNNIRWVANFNEEDKMGLFRDEFLSKVDNYSERFLEEIKGGKKFSEWLDEILYLDMKTWLVDDILMKVDKVSMAFSLEARVPFLDFNFVEFMTSIPSSLKIKNFSTKFLLKSVVSELLPDEIICRAKKPFNVPASDWFRNEFKGLTLDILLNKGAAINAYFSSKYIKRLFGEHFAGKEDHHQKIWNILCFELWHRIFIQRTPVENLVDMFRESLSSSRRKSRVNVLIPWDYPPTRGGIQTYMHSIYSKIESGSLVVIVDNIKGSFEFDIFEKYSIKRLGIMWLPDSSKIKKIIFYIYGTIYAMLLAFRGRIALVHCGHIYSGMIAIIIKKLFGVKYIVWTHALEIMDNRRKKIIKYILSNSASIITNSNFTGRFIKKLCGDSVNIYKIPPPVDISRFTPGLDCKKIIERHGLVGKKIVLSVCRITRLQRYKGVDKVIEAFGMVRRMVPDAVYVIVGGGDFHNYYKSLVKRSGLSDSVVFAGNISNEELPLYYSACDLFIMPSREEVSKKGILAEGFGIVFLEANACGKPVIGGRSGGIPDAVKDGETGLLVDPDNVDEIADAIIKLLTDEKLAREIGRKGRERVEREFTVDVAVRKLKEVIDEVEKK